MSIIDWSDSEEMLGLLAEYVRDERRDAGGDRDRLAFLRELSMSVDALASQADAPLSAVRARLQAICDAQSAEFADDAVMVHVRDCLDELSRLISERGQRQR